MIIIFYSEKRGKVMVILEIRKAISCDLLFNDYRDAKLKVSVFVHNTQSPILRQIKFFCTKAKIV